MTQRHKAFVSYHHDNDQAYRDKFETLFENVHDILVSKSVQIGDIGAGLTTETIRQKIRDEYLADSTVTIVLIGTETWQRKHVDWEIGSSVRDTKNNPRSGLLAILLPTYSGYAANTYDSHTIPPRLTDNLNNKPPFATIYKWSDDPATMQGWIHAAFARRDTVVPDNSRDSFGKNHTGTRWTD